MHQDGAVAAEEVRGGPRGLGIDTVAPQQAPDGVDRVEGHVPRDDPDPQHGLAHEQLDQLADPRIEVRIFPIDLRQRFDHGRALLRSWYCGR